MSTTVTTDIRDLWLPKAADRCDTTGCGARAYVLALFRGGSELLFCAHDGRKNKAALEKAGATIVDKTDLIEPPKPHQPETD